MGEICFGGKISPDAALSKTEVVSSLITDTDRGIVNTRQTVEFAALVSAYSQQLLACPEPLPRVAIQRYWESSQKRLKLWLSAITAFQRRGTDLPEQEHAELWRELEPVLSEIFVSEILTRVWGAILTALDWELSCHDYEPIARNVLIGHLDARRRALILLASDGRVSQEHLARVDQIRRRVERWTDLLLGHLVDHYPVEDFAFEPQRAHDFCSEDLLQSANRPRQQAWNLVLIGLKMAFPEPAEIDPPNELLQHQIVSSMLQCFPPEAFLGDGPFRSLLRDQESDEFSENRFDCAANPDPMSDLELRLPPQATVNLISFRKLRGRLPPPKG